METCMKMLSTTSEITEAPEYIKVLPCGYVSSEKGDFVVDSESFRMMKTYMQHRKIDIVIDYEHQTLRDTQAPAGGWIKELILKKDGIFARVEWTDRAKNYLRNKEYRYLSPVVLVRNKDKKAFQLHSVALTNTPAINGMTPVVNSVRFNGEENYNLDDMQRQICKMLNIKESDFVKYGENNRGDAK